MRIDAHQHFWAIARGDYGWLTPDLTELYRDFGPDDLAPLLKEHGVDGTILVQAAPTVAETHYMLELAEAHDFVKGVVGWVDFESSDAPETISALANHPKLVGLRPMIQDIPDPNWMLQDSLAPAFSAMVEADLVFDALTMPWHLRNLAELIGRHPALRVVVDHGSKPQIGDGQFDGWAADMAQIAAKTSASVKLSGLVTEASESWRVADLEPFVAHLLEHFGSDRLIWGSDWPVCTLASSYCRWCDATEHLLADQSEADRAAIFGGNALRLYRPEITEHNLQQQGVIARP